MNTITKDQFLKDIKGKTPVLIDFYADWCGPCKMLTPIMLKLSEENTEKDVTIGKVNVDASSEIGVKYGVRNIPTLVFLKDGVEVDRTVGVQTKDSLQTKIDTLLN